MENLEPSLTEYSSSCCACAVRLSARQLGSAKVSFGKIVKEFRDDDDTESLGHKTRSLCHRKGLKTVH